MPGRLGPRFALEALFLIALAVGAGFADLATRWILLIMGVGWLVVALLELTAERIWAAAPPWRRPYYVPVPPPSEEPAAVVEPPPPVVEPEPIPALEAATVIAPRVELEPEPEPELEPEPEPEPGPETEPEPEASEPGRPRLEPLQPRPKRRWFRRRDRDALTAEPAEATPPKHVRLLPASERGSRIEEEVSEIFDAPEREEQSHL
jgi:outer membrane biosynthesis protein TonB